MKRVLAVTMLTLGIAAYGCGDDDDGTGTDGGAGGSMMDGAAGGAGGTTTDGGADRADMAAATDGAAADMAGATDGAAADAAATDGAATDAAATDAAGATDTAPSAMMWATCANPKTGVSAGEFCNYYGTTCMFGAGATSFMDMAACVARYNSYNDTQKGCAAYHLCVAGTPPAAGMPADANKTLHCPHPAQAGGPCTLPAR